LFRFLPICRQVSSNGKNEREELSNSYQSHFEQEKLQLNSAAVASQTYEEIALIKIFFISFAAYLQAGFIEWKK